MLAWLLSRMITYVKLCNDQCTGTVTVTVSPSGHLWQKLNAGVTLVAATVCVTG